jgi:hypothetical protein
MYRLDCSTRVPKWANTGEPDTASLKVNELRGKNGVVRIKQRAVLACT